MLTTKLAQLRSCTSGLSGQQRQRAYKVLSVLTDPLHEFDIRKIMLEFQNIAGPVVVPTGQIVVAPSDSPPASQGSAATQDSSSDLTTGSNGCDTRCPHCNKKIHVSVMKA